MISILLIATAVQAATPAAPKTPSPRDTEWERCIGKDAAVQKAARVPACDRVLAMPGLGARERGLAYLWRARAQATIPNLAGALTDVERGLAVAGAPAAVQGYLYTFRGNIRYDQKRRADAKADFDRAVQVAPGDPDALMARAAFALDDKRFADAERDLGAADQGGLNAEFHAHLHVLRGSAREALKNVSGATADFNRAVEVGPQVAFAWHQRGLFAERQGRHEDALRDYAKTTELAPRDADGFNGVCWMLAAKLKREFDRARTACDTAVMLAPNDAAIADSAGLVALQQKRWQAAWTHYDRAVRLQAKRAEYRYGRGLAALRLGRTAAGNADIAAATTLDPTVVVPTPVTGRGPRKGIA